MEEAPAHTSALAVYSNLLAGFGFSGQSEVVPMSGRRVCRLRSRMTSLNASYTYGELQSERRRSHGVAVAGARTAAAAQKGHGATSAAITTVNKLQPLRKVGKPEPTARIRGLGYARSRSACGLAAILSVRKNRRLLSTITRLMWARRHSTVRHTGTTRVWSAPTEPAQADDLNFVGLLTLLRELVAEDKV